MQCAQTSIQFQQFVPSLLSHPNQKPMYISLNFFLSLLFFIWILLILLLKYLLNLLVLFSCGSWVFLGLPFQGSHLHFMTLVKLYDLLGQWNMCRGNIGHPQIEAVRLGAWFTMTYSPNTRTDNNPTSVGGSISLNCGAKTAETCSHMISM